MTGPFARELKPPPVRPEVDWKRVSQQLRAGIHANWGAIPSSEIDDLVQEASIRLLRMTRSSQVRNLDAARNDILRKTVTDYFRSRGRWAALVVRLDAEPEPAARDRDPFGDPLERCAFTVLEFFRGEKASCYEIAQRYLGGAKDWIEVAQAMNTSPEATRKRWSRCVAALRRAAGEDGRGLWSWARPWDRAGR